MSSQAQIAFLDKDWTQLGEYLLAKNYSSYYILCDENTYQYCMPILESKKIFRNPTVIHIVSGEENKSLDSVDKICSKMLEEGIDRKSLCIALGGGLICDLMGFCASIILRGVDCIYLPTSLLAMADASVGGKTGINFKGWKNQIGTFSEPKLVAIDTQFLDTLDHRNRRNGFVEMIKHSLLLGKDEYDLIENLDISKNDVELLNKIKESIEFKLKIVQEDFKEESIRKKLNLGHTMGHAIESFLLKKGLDVLHGEAIALGLIYELKIAGILYYNNDNYFSHIVDYLIPFSINYQFDSIDKQEIIRNLNGDKKKLNNKINFCLLFEIGDCRINVQVEDKIIIQVLDLSPVFN